MAETAITAAARLTAEGATVEGEDSDSVIAAAILALDMAGDDLPPPADVTAYVLHFGEDGSVTVHALDAAQAKAALAAAPDSEKVLVSKEDLERAFDEARAVKDSSLPPPQQETEAPSIPPPPPLPAA